MATFSPCARCGKVINDELLRCPYCQQSPRGGDDALPAHPSDGAYLRKSGEQAEADAAAERRRRQQEAEQARADAEKEAEKRSNDRSATGCGCLSGCLAPLIAFFVVAFTFAVGARGYLASGNEVLVGVAAFSAAFLVPGGYYSHKKGALGIYLRWSVATLIAILLGLGSLVP